MHRGESYNTVLHYRLWSRPYPPIHHPTEPKGFAMGSTLAPTKASKRKRGGGRAKHGSEGRGRKIPDSRMRGLHMYVQQVLCGNQSSIYAQQSMQVPPYCTMLGKHRDKTHKLQHPRYTYRKYTKKQWCLRNVDSCACFLFTGNFLKIADKRRTV